MRAVLEPGHAYRPGRRLRQVDRLNLSRYIRCQRQPATIARLHRDWARMIKERWEVAHPMSWAIASWYDDAGATGCGFHAGYGIATFIVPCGGQVTISGPAGTVIATRDDSGPYVAGRLFDLDPAVKAATGCGDLCRVAYRTGGGSG
jgi:hypothetical protein